MWAGCEDAVWYALFYEHKFYPAMKNYLPVNLTMRVAVKFTIIPKKVKKDFFPRSLYFDKEDLKSKIKPSLYPPPNIEEADSTNSTGN